MTVTEPDRRHLLTGLGLLSLTAAAAPWRALAAAAISPVPRARVIIDNDFSGDPDGLFQLAHHLLSPSVAVPFVIGSHIHAGDFLDGSPTQGDNAAARARTLIAMIGSGHHPPVLAGRNTAPPPGAPPQATAITRRILAEAWRSDTKLPLVYAAGAGLTELAEAVRIDPAIGPRIRLVWIGGREWPDLTGGVPWRRDAEYNMTIDGAAARTLFNDSTVEIWQVPRNVYRQMLVSMAELRAALRPAGAVGAFLLDALEQVRRHQDDRLGETYILGDSPLVTLTALLSSFEPDASSSDYVIRPTPILNEDGSYTRRAEARPMRVYRSIDARLTFGDLFAKLAIHR
ncbi:nucleoside hydrolase [Sphingomonas sp. RIT328]|uniref:nucleoside hydrolase n=1 Tax=Sphingomonas sp. RIT328 TaxID=1470591 RepID=UPI000452753C|nr:nucleoside hydrolase [Sphingomonas sp. RIT328]EZP49995.1 Twin-arginine translocation pathway signal precursor [Sphingomonas sp. RIT328]